MTALADRVSMAVDRADFDDLVTLVTQAPTWEKDRLQGVRMLLRAIGEGKATRPSRSSRAGRGGSPARRARCRTGARAPSSRRRSACSARSRTRAATGTRRTRPSSSTRRSSSRSRSAPRCSPRPRATRRARTQLIDAARERLGDDPGGRQRARRQPARAEGSTPAARAAGGASARSRRQAQAARAASQSRARSGAARTAPTPDGATPAEGRQDRRRAAEAVSPASSRDCTARRMAGVLVLLGIGFVAGPDHGALAVRAAGAADPARGRRERRPAAAVRDHRRARRQLHVFTLVGAWLLDRSACRRTSCGTSRSRCCSSSRRR